MRTSRATRFLMAAVVAGLLCSLAAACGSSSDSKSSGGSATAAASSSASTSITSCQKQAQAKVAQYRAPLPVKVPSETLDLSKVAGKKLWIILTVKNQFTQAVSAGAVEAIKRMGAVPTVFDGKGQVTQWNAGVGQAVAQGADGIILWGVDPAIVSKPLKQAKAKGIAVVSVWNGAPTDPLPPNVDAISTSDFGKSAEIAANVAMADSGCKANLALFTTKALPLFDPYDKEQSIFQQNCAGDCKWQKVQIDLATMPTSLGPLVSSTVRRDPSIQYVQAAFDSQVTFMLPSLGASKVKIIGHDGAPAILDQLRKGNKVIADIAQPPEQWIGYTMADQLARVASGQKPVDATYPDRLIDKTNIGASNDEIWSSWSDWKQKFMAKWAKQ